MSTIPSSSIPTGAGGAVAGGPWSLVDRPHAIEGRARLAWAIGAGLAMLAAHGAMVYGLARHRGVPLTRILGAWDASLHAVIAESGRTGALWAFYPLWAGLLAAAPVPLRALAIASWLGVNVWVTRELAYGKWAYECPDRDVLIAAAADPIAATRSLVAPPLDVPRGTPAVLAPRVRRLASVPAASLCSPHPGRSTGRRTRRARRSSSPSPGPAAAARAWSPLPG
jgi:hypothetical protein